MYYLSTRMYNFNYGLFVGVSHFLIFPVLSSIITIRITRSSFVLGYDAVN